VLPKDAPLDLPMQCFDGENACPPEDVGGVGGYKEFCKIMLSPKHKQRKAMRLLWYGFDPDDTTTPFNPSDFDPNEANLDLLRYIR
jgi:hypothetical protein